LSIFSGRKSEYWKRPTIRRVHGERVSTDALLKGNAVPKPLPSFWPLLNDPHKFLVKIGAGRSTSDYAKNSDVFVQGTVADSIFYLQEGRVKVTVTSEQGEEATVAILEAGHFFGVGCLSGQTHRIVTTKALTDCRITAIEKASMIKALEDQPWFSKFFIDHLHNRNRRIEGGVMDQLFSSSEQRLASLLLEKIDVQQSLLESVLRDKLMTSDGDPDDQ
jgi:CRP/FNR family transcriptional regulator, cyclic AMP receptor protein